MVVITEGLSDWVLHHGDLLYAGRGAQGLLSEPLTAFFSSRQCPAAIRAAMDWTLEQARSRLPVVSGFHSPLEQSVLTVLLQARCPVVEVLARPVVSAATRSGRLTEELAAQRNEWVMALASEIVVAYASQGGRLAVLCDEWTGVGRSVRRLG